jgi:hypothetical protein
MTASSFYRVILPSWRAVLIGLAIGAIIGAILYKTVLGSTFAVTVIQAGRIGGAESTDIRVTPQLVIDRRSAPAVLIDRMQTPEFTTQVATMIGDPSAALIMSGRQYGGYGRLQARSVSDGTLVEIRVSLTDPDQALQAAAAAGQLAIKADSDLLAELHKNYAKRIDALQSEIAAAQKLASTIEHSIETDPAAQTPATIAAAADRQSKVEQLNDTLWSLERALMPPASQESTVFAAPSLARPIVGHLWIALLAGAIAGAAAGYAVGFSIRLGRYNVPPQSLH